MKSKMRFWRVCLENLIHGDKLYGYVAVVCVLAPNDDAAIYYARRRYFDDWIGIDAEPIKCQEDPYMLNRTGVKVEYDFSECENVDEDEEDESNWDGEDEEEHT